jgi:hypothetical protein
MGMKPGLSLGKGRVLGNKILSEYLNLRKMK